MPFRRCFSGSKGAVSPGGPAQQASIRQFRGATPLRALSERPGEDLEEDPGPGGLEEVEQGPISSHKQAHNVKNPS